MFKVKILVEAYTEAEVDLMSMGENVKPSLLKEMVFYDITSISKDLWEEGKSLIYAGGNCYCTPYDIDKVERIIDEAKQKHERDTGFWKN